MFQMRFSVVLLILSAIFTGMQSTDVLAQSNKYPSHAMVSYMSWLPTSFNSAGISHPTDFPVMSLLDRNGKVPATDRQSMVAVGHELKYLADNGWDCMLADFLFFEPSHITRQIANTQTMLNAADYFDLPANFKVATFFETMGGKSRKHPDFLADGLIRYLKAIGNHPRHLKIDGRPVMLFYGADRRSTSDWKIVLDKIHAQGLNPFVIYEHGGLMPALFGRFNPKEAAGFGELFDGAYSFGASGLEAATGMVTSLRKVFKNQKTGQYIGGTIWPGYLSDRSTNRNFISPRHTGFLRSVWEKTLAQKPDFLQWSTWNDYHESTSLGCTFSHLTSRLEISRRYLAQYNVKPLPQSDDGLPQSVLSYRKTLQSGEPIAIEFLPLPCSDVTGRAVVTVTLLDQANKVIAQQSSDAIDLQQMQPWDWSLDTGIQRSQTRVVRVRASLKLADGRQFDYANLPDIAIVRGIHYTDQLFYCVPLHRMADSSRSLRMLINDVDGADGAVAPHEGTRVIDYRITGKDADKAQVSAMRDGHLLRFLAPLAYDGAYTLNPREADRPIVLRKRAGNEPAVYCDWRKPITREGEDYYAAVVQFADGKWAYSPTVWSVPSESYETTSVLWSFVPQGKRKLPITGFEDWSGHEAKVQLIGKGELSFDKLSGNLRMLRLDGKQILQVPLDYAPNGPMSVDVVINPKSVSRTNVICYQRGAQVSLIIRPDGLLEARRLPELRKHPNPMVKVQSQSRLQAGQFYHVVVTYDGRNLSMYLNGQLQDQSPCTGTRSSERCTIGGNIVDAASKQVDDLDVTGGFEGRMLRMIVSSRAWSPQQVQARFQRVSMLPCWK